MMIKEEIVKLSLPYSDKVEKTVRVYIPEHEEGETFPVIYMTDGQNLFDEETSSFGSWFTSEAVRAEKEKNGKAAIIVGIHNDESPLSRNNDLTPKSMGRINGLMMKLLAFPSPRGETFARFVTEVVKPAVEERFPVKTGRENTAFCGSSSGGLESFFIALTYPALFSAAGVFSPAFDIYRPKDLESWIRTKIGQDSPFLYVYIGAGDPREKKMWKAEQKMIPVLRQLCPPERLKEVVIPEALHNEAAWKPIFEDFLHLFLAEK